MLLSSEGSENPSSALVFHVETQKTTAKNRMGQCHWSNVSAGGQLLFEEEGTA